MLDIVTTSFYIKAPAFRRQEFENYSTDLFDEWDKYVETNLNLPDYALTLVIEEGSIKGGGKIAATAAALYFAIGGYGDFVSGLNTIRDQASYVTNALFDQAKRSFGCGSARGNSKKTGGEIFHLENLFEKVQRGVITPDQAMNEVRRRWGDEAASPKFLQDLASSLADAPRYPEQLTLTDESWEYCTNIDTDEREPRPRIPRAPEMPIPQHYRIEIYRSSKGDKKKVKLTKLK
jgi:hypothetical protein